MSQILQAVSKECSDIGWRDKMKNCTKAFLNARDVSAQEVVHVYRLLSFPLFKSNFRKVFVPADLPHVKSSFNFTWKMGNEDEDIFQKIFLTDTMPDQHILMIPAWLHVRCGIFPYTIRCKPQQSVIVIMKTLQITT